jgi:phosphoglycerate dehydrogenase-like enzyme
VTPRLRRLLGDADALVTTWDSPCFGEELLALAPRLRLIAHCGGEVKARFARPLLERLVIANAPGPMAHLVAELAATFLLMAARRVDGYREALRRPSNRIYGRLHLEGTGAETLWGRTVGLLGFGRIGRETARLLRPFGPRLLVHDPYVEPATVRRGGGVPAGLARVLRRSEYLVIAAGLTDATRGLLSRAALGLLRCALDVTDPLEPLPVRHPLRRMKGAILTPHVGAAAVDVRRTMADVVLDALERFFAGKRVHRRVTLAMLDRMT